MSLLGVVDLRNIGMKDCSNEELEGIVKQINIMTQGKNSEFERFVGIFFTKANKNYAIAVQEYKQLLRNEGRGNISLSDIEQAYYNKDLELLQRLLMELSLTYISYRQLNKIIEKMEFKNLTIKDLYERHKERPNRSIISIMG